MRHLHTGRKLGVGADRKKALMRSLTLALIEKDSIHTTPARAKELRWFADRVVTLAKRGDLASRRQIVKLLGSTETYVTGENRARKAIERIYSSLAPRFKDRNGGYTQLLRLSTRRPGDGAEMCIMRYIPEVTKGENAKKALGGEKSKKAQKPTPKAKIEASAKEDKKAKKAAPADVPTEKKKKTKKEEPQDK